jgi:hypothetical protein
MFEQFWKHYPRKVAKRAALGAFNRLARDEQSHAIEGIEYHLVYWKLKGTEMDFIPHASTWLNQGRFEDELDMTPKEVKRPSLPWYSNDELTLAKGRELGLNAYAGESMGQYRQRIHMYIHRARQRHI